METAAARPGVAEQEPLDALVVVGPATEEVSVRLPAAGAEDVDLTASTFLVDGGISAAYTTPL